jgi:ASC-1-like (ASCH) protein
VPLSSALGAANISYSQENIMQTITGLFDRYEDASDAVRALEGAGIPSGDISIVANNSDSFYDRDGVEDAAEGVEAGAGIGALVGGTGGLLAGLGILAVPGVGPVVAGGWLLATAIGAVTGAAVGGAAGGIIGSLTDAGVPESDAHVYAEGVRRGGTLVTARVEDNRARIAEDILNKAERIDVQSRRALYEQEGWETFDPEAPAYTPEEVRDYRSIYSAQRTI